MRCREERSWSYSISTLLTRNVHDVFGENDFARRRAAIHERSLRTRNPREIRECKARKVADRLESWCEEVSCHDMTRYIRRLEWVLREASDNMFPLRQIDGE